MQSDFVEQLRRSVDRLIPAGEKVLLACSGGGDSVALVLGWRQFAGERGDDLTIAHFNHKLRPDSDSDSRFVEEFAESLHLPFVAGTSQGTGVDPKGSKRHRTVEEAARIARYRFLAQAAEERQIRFVVTAHTQDDQVETILHAIIRGTGFRGLAGMRSSRRLDCTIGDDLIAQELKLVRPMLDIDKATAFKFLNERRQSFCSDDSNANPAFTRNRIRHVLLPLIRREFNPAVNAAISRLGKQAIAMDDLLAKQARRLLRKSQRQCEDHHSIKFDLQALRDSSRLVLGRLFLLALDAKDWPRGEWTARHVERLTAMALTHQPSRMDLPGRTMARIAKGIASNGDNIALLCLTRKP